MIKDKKSSVISRLNCEWEATITMALPLATLNKLAQKAARQGVKPLEYMKATLTALANQKEGK